MIIIETYLFLIILNTSLTLNFFVMNLKQELEQRWFVYQLTDEKLFDIYDKWNETLYFGMDPTADSLHLWNLVNFMSAINFMKRWNKLILIVWWATGMIWDPGWKDAERNFLDEETLNKNVESIKKQVTNITNHLSELSGYKFDFEVINNYDFYKNMSILEFLRNAGKHITINQMMNKETVKKRIEDPDKSISFTEFSYMLLQWYDFYKLFSEKWVKLQISWSDQWGNCVTGIEIIKKIIRQGAAPPRIGQYLHLHTFLCFAGNGIPKFHPDCLMAKLIGFDVHILFG